MHYLWIAAVTVVILQMSVFFTTIYLHRCITHRGLSLHPVVGNLMHLHLALFTGLLPREWAAVHRKHHHFSDKEGDPHSPYIEGLWQVFFGNYFYYKREANNPATIRKYTPDYKPDLIDRIPLVRYALFGGLAIFMALFGWEWGLAAWLFHIVAYVLLNSSINSLCHMVGYRNFNNKATNLRSIALMTGGEGLHNNHHAFPSAARFAMRGHEFDPAWVLIRVLEAVGLAEVKPEPLARAA